MLLVTVDVNSRRYALSDGCFVVPTVVMATTGTQFATNNTLFPGLLNDSDVFSGVGGSPGTVNVEFQWGRALKSTDYVVLVALSPMAPLSVTGIASTGQVLVPVTINSSQYGTAATGFQRTVTAVNGGSRVLQNPQAVAVQLAELGTSSTSALVLSRINVTLGAGFDFDLSFVGLVDSTCVVFLDQTTTSLQLPPATPC